MPGSGPNTVWLNDGIGNFTANGQVLGTDATFGFELGDLDGDGDLDAFIANTNAQNDVWLNNGDGTFVLHQSLGAAGDVSMNVNLADFDNDGDLDAYVVNWALADQLWLNDGAGNFVNSGATYAYTGNRYTAIAADFDGVSGLTTDEDTAIALDISATLVDTDGSETLSIVIAGVPTGATLSAGTNTGGGSWTLTAADLDGLTLTPAQDSTAQITLTVTATATETANNDTASTSGNLTITINSLNDAPVISFVAGNETGSVNEGNPGDAAITTTGQLTSTDVDAAATAVWAVNGGGVGTYGSLGVNQNGLWTYTLNNEAANVQALAAGDDVTDTFTITVTDGQGGSDTQNVAISINGTNDAPVVSAGGDTGSVDEGNPGDAAITTTGQLASTDVDNGAGASWSGGGAGTYGGLSIVPETGVWTYTLSNEAANVFSV